MATLTVNGTMLPEPSKKTNGIQMIGDSKRSANGTMNMQYIANKRKYTIQWGTMTPSQLQNMVSIIKSTTPQFTLTILDSSISGGSYTGIFYAGDVAWDDIKIDAYGNITFQNVKADLIES
jgi:hypothetical protein